MNLRFFSRSTPAATITLVALSLVSASTLAQDILVDRDEKFEPKTTVAPFAFYNENLSFGAGPVFVSNGHIQDQLSLLVGGFVTANGSANVFLFGKDWKVPFGDRFFADWRVSLATYDEIESYTDGNPRYLFERAGSNDSHEDNFIEGDGEDYFLRFNLKYLLPIGHGKDTIINTVVLDRGLLHGDGVGGDAFNPLASGRTYLEMELFYRNQNVDADFTNFVRRTNGLRFGVHYDKRDFADNPTRGNDTRLSVSRDFGSMDSTGNWTSIEGSYSHFFDLGETDTFRKIVLALNARSVYSPTWDDDHGQPPLFAGASLGGLDRMRGFPEFRFYDKAAIYYAAELRMIPDWNPLGPGSFLDGLKVDWIMFAPFIEIGRVADHWSFSELHSNLKWSAGVGFRIMATHTVLRLDTAASDEGMRVQMMVQHPF